MLNMAAKLSKQEKRILAKQIKSQKTLFRHENIICCDSPTQHLVVANGGLGNDIEREELWTIFSPFGQISDIVMRPRKPYAFVSFTDAKEATDAVINVHGRMLRHPEELSRPNVVFYLSYIEKIPDMKKYPDESILPSGLIIVDNYVSEDIEQELLKTIDCNQESGVNESLKHRYVKHFGYQFLYTTNNIDRENPLDQKIPDECSAVLHRLLDENLISRMPDQLTVNQYRPGQGIPPHVDTHSAFEDEIIILSLGSQIIMDFDHPSGCHIPVLLPIRSIAILTGESRYLWSHGITPRKSDIVTAPGNGELNPGERRLTLFKRGTRTSFTFRTVRHTPCDCNYSDQCDSQRKSSSEKDGGQTNSANPLLPKTNEEALKLESLHVHQVYEKIANHFSDTRHSPWPRVVKFIQQLPDNVLIADVGCGNGKYLDVVPNRFMIGCDRSVNLCEICCAKGHCVLVCDGLLLPFRDEVFDAVICIAVIHHLCTQERRIQALEEIARILRPNGKALVYVWAMEQEKGGVKSKYLKSSKTDTQKEVIKDDTKSCSSPTPCSSSELSNSLTVEMPVHVNRTSFKFQDLLVPWHAKSGNKTSKVRQDCGTTNCGENCEIVSGLPTNTENSTGNSCDNGVNCDKDVDVPNEKEIGTLFHRYYHVFQKGELEQLCSLVSCLTVKDSYYDQGNWCVVVEKKAAAAFLEKLS